MGKAMLTGVILVSLTAMPLFTLAGTNWYDGGTLHKSDISQWNKATYANKLATAADWVLALKSSKAKVRHSNTMETLRPFAEKLVQCVNEAAAGHAFEGNKVGVLAANCMILKGW